MIAFRAGSNSVRGMFQRLVIASSVIDPKALSMMFCQFAKTVWRNVKQSIPLQLKRKEFTTPRLWLFEFLSSASEIQATTLSVAFYLIWEARNDARSSEAKPCPSWTSGKIVAFVDFIKQHLYKEVPV
jgi:hypothetical protein